MGILQGALPAGGLAKWGAIAGMAAVAVLAGRALSLDRYFSLVFAALALTGAALALAIPARVRSQAGFPLLIVVAVLMPIELGPSGGSLNGAALLAMALCGIWLARLSMRRQEAALDGSRVVVAALAFMAVAGLSFVVGQYPWFPAAPAPMRAQLGGLAVFLLSGGLFLVVGHAISSLAELRRLTWLFVAAGAAAVLTSVTPFFEYRAGSIAITDASSIGSMFWIWLVAISASQGLFNRELSGAARLALIAVGLLALARGLLLAFSWTSGWLPPLVALGLVMLLRFPRTTVVLGLLVIASALFFGGPVFNAWMAEESYSSMTRMQALTVMLRIIDHNPWLGFGPANYYHYTLLYPLLGWWVRFNSHNNYVDLVAQTGVVGLLAFSWFVLEVARLAWRLRSRVPAGFAQAYAVGALAGLAGSLVSGFLADWIVPFAYNVGIRGFRSSLLFWVFLGGLLAVKRILATSPALAAPAPSAVGMHGSHATVNRLGGLL